MKVLPHLRTEAAVAHAGNFSLQRFARGEAVAPGLGLCVSHGLGLDSMGGQGQGSLWRRGRQAVRHRLDRVEAVTAEAVDGGGLTAAIELLVSAVATVAVQRRQGDKTRIE